MTDLTHIEDLLYSIMDKLDELKQSALNPPAPVPEPVTAAISDEEISLNLSGTPDLHIRAPGQFAAIKHLYDPRREPFTASTFHTYGSIKADNRPWKPVTIVTEDYPLGILVRKATPQSLAMAPRSYWEDMGYIIDDKGDWWTKA